MHCEMTCPMTSMHDLHHMLFLSKCIDEVTSVTREFEVRASVMSLHILHMIIQSKFLLITIYSKSCFILPLYLEIIFRHSVLNCDKHYSTKSTSWFLFYFGNFLFPFGHFPFVSFPLCGLDQSEVSIIQTPGEIQWHSHEVQNRPITAQ